MQKGGVHMDTPTLYRRRFIPNETVHLKDDIILQLTEDFILTKWVALHPRSDIAAGISAYYLDQGIKVSKILDKNNNLVYWYCDIIQSKHDAIKNTIIFEDLLIDVILLNDGTIRIVDIDELADALDQNLITQSEATYALRRLDNLLRIIRDGNFHTLQEPILQAE